MAFLKYCQDTKIPKCYFDCNIKNLKSLQPIAEKFLETSFPLMLYGEPGTGKTYFMLCLIREILETQGYKRDYFRFISAMDLDDRITYDFKTFGSAKYFIEQLIDEHFLFIDDFGIEKSKDQAERNYYQVLDNRLGNQKTTLISTNLKEEEVLNIYGARIHSRLKQCITLHFKGEDYRKPPQL